MTDERLKQLIDVAQHMKERMDEHEETGQPELAFIFGMAQVLVWMVLREAE